MSAGVYDVLIVGSGPAGVSAAFPLLRAGLNVAMVDGARDEPALANDRVRASFGPDYSALLPQDERSPKQRLYRSRAMTRAHAERTGLTTRGFRASGAVARGGLSTVWGAYTAEFDAGDLQGYPFAAQDLRVSYDAIARRIGISGSRDDALGVFHGAATPLQAPPPLHPAAELILRNTQSAPAGALTLGLARNALLTEAMEERQACVLCKGCLWPCAGGSIYASTHDLARLRRLRGFSLLDDFYVTRLERAGDVWHAVGEGGPLRARRVLLAAGTLGTARIAAQSLGLQGQALPLLSNPLVALPLWLPRAAMLPTPALGHTLAQLGLRLDLGAGAYATGALYNLDGLPLDFISAKLPLSLAAAAQVSAWLAGSVLVATVYFSGDYAANTLRLDAGAAGGLHIEGGTREDFDAVCADALRRLRAELRRLGALPLPGAERAPMGLDNHYAGTCPMGGTGLLATGTFGEFNAMPGVYAVDGAALPRLPAKHLTFTMMANADRIARQVAAGLRQNG